MNLVQKLIKFFVDSILAATSEAFNTFANRFSKSFDVIEGVPIWKPFELFNRLQAWAVLVFGAALLFVDDLLQIPYLGIAKTLRLLIEDSMPTDFKTKVVRLDTAVHLVLVGVCDAQFDDLIWNLDNPLLSRAADLLENSGYYRKLTQHVLAKQFIEVVKMLWEKALKRAGKRVVKFFLKIIQYMSLITSFQLALLLYLDFQTNRIFNFRGSALSQKKPLRTLTSRHRHRQISPE